MKTLSKLLIPMIAGSLAIGGCGDNKKESEPSELHPKDDSLPKIKWDKELFKEFKDLSVFDEHMSNGRYVTYCSGTTEEKSGDLYIFDTKKEVGLKATNTPNEDECGAKIYGDYIAFFSDYKSEYGNKKLRQIKIINYKTGEINLVGKPKEYEEIKDKRIVFRNNGKTIELVNDRDYDNIHKNPFELK